MTLIANVGYVLLLINFLLFIKIVISKKEKPLRVFLFYLLTIVFIQIASEYFHNTGNLFISHYYFISQTILLSYFYYLIIENDKVKKLIKIIASFTLISLAFQYFFYPELYDVFNVYEIFICIIPLVIYALSHLFQTLGNPNKKYIYITSGVLIYFSPHALVFSSGNLMPDLPGNVNRIIWLINVILYLVYLILIFVEWYKHFRKNSVIAHKNN